MGKRSEDRADDDPADPAHVRIADHAADPSRLPDHSPAGAGLTSSAPWEVRAAFAGRADVTIPTCSLAPEAIGHAYELELHRWARIRASGSCRLPCHSGGN